MIKLIVAYDKDRAIGANNTIPWFIKGELKWVAEETKRVSDKHKVNALIMGRKTWESIPETRRPLVDRINIVVSKTMVSDNQEDLIVCDSLESAISYVKYNTVIESTFIFGGSSIYKQALEMGIVDIVMATEVQVKKDYVADTFFPELPSSFVGFTPNITKYGDDIVCRTVYANQRKTVPESIVKLDMNNKETLVNLLLDVQCGNVSCRRAATEIISDFMHNSV